LCTDHDNQRAAHHIDDHDGRANDDHVSNYLSDDNDFDDGRPELSRRILYMGVVGYDFSVDSVE
jgi:hypothetical protein